MVLPVAPRKIPATDATEIRSRDLSTSSTVPLTTVLPQMPLIDPCKIYFQVDILFVLLVVSSTLPQLWSFFWLFYLWSCTWLLSTRWVGRSWFTGCLLILVANMLFLQVRTFCDFSINTLKFCCVPLVSWERFKPITLYLITSRKFPIVSFHKNEVIIFRGIQIILLIFLLSSYP